MKLEVIHRDNVCEVLKVNNNHYDARGVTSRLFMDTEVKLQNGSPTVNGENGLTMEALIAITIDALTGRNQGNFKCIHNDLALEHLTAAKAALDQRVKDRQERGVFDTPGK